MQCAGSLKQLILTGLPKLEHLKVCQNIPRSDSKVMARCKALKLPHSLLSFDLTINTPALSIDDQLTVLYSLPHLQTVGLHRRFLHRIPQLPTTVTRCSLPHCCRQVSHCLCALVFDASLTKCEHTYHVWKASTNAICEDACCLEK